MPESLDPSGYTELTAVLDDVRASVDPTFTPTAAPSEPADVGDGHDHADEGQADDEHEEARSAPGSPTTAPPDRRPAGSPSVVERPDVGARSDPDPPGRPLQLDIGSERDQPPK